MKDHLNPEYVFQTINTELLLKIINTGNIEDLLKKELANRGIDKSGQWCGFEKAYKEWGVK